MSSLAAVSVNQRETEEQAKRDTLTVVLANRAATDRAEGLDREAGAIRARLNKAPPVNRVKPLADSLGRILSLPADTAATAQQVAIRHLFGKLTLAPVPTPEPTPAATRRRFRSRHCRRFM
jgi:hypothetical protein